MKRGKIRLNGATLEKHELETARFYAEQGKDVECILPSNTPHAKRGDFLIGGLIWEAKRPRVESRRALERIFYRACSQSENIILDLRSMRQDDRWIELFEKCFLRTRRVRRMDIISKDGRLRKYKK